MDALLIALFYYAGGIVFVFIVAALRIEMNLPPSPTAQLIAYMVFWPVYAAILTVSITIEASRAIHTRLAIRSRVQ
ncbi:MAG: hypothetical protein HQL38_07935 [Alphaproteobacteria bacterium]|nr:hypothetical protein [Alphaproteobacteria bacterium]